MHPASQLLSNDAVRKMYEQYQGKFVSFARKYYDVPPEDAGEIYHESFIKLYENLQANKYKDSGYSLHTYLFGIGKNYIKKYWERKERTDKVRQIPAQEWLLQYYKNHEWEEAQDVARRLIYESAGDCNKILQLYYWERKKMTEIAQLMDYKTEQVAKNKKRSCLQKITLELKGRLKKIGINWK